MRDINRISVETPLSTHFNCAVLTCANRLFPTGYDVTSDDSGIGDSLGSLRRAVADNGGRMIVWSGASDRTIFGDPEVNWAFRAWHDWHHLRLGAEFTPEGEELVWKAQAQDITRLYGMRGAIVNEMQALLRAEILGQLEHQRAWGVFPNDQRGFVAAYVSNASSAMQRCW